LTAPKIPGGERETRWFGKRESLQEGGAAEKADSGSVLTKVRPRYERTSFKVAPVLKQKRQETTALVGGERDRQGRGKCHLRIGNEKGHSGGVGADHRGLCPTQNKLAATGIGESKSGGEIAFRGKRGHPKEQNDRGVQVGGLHVKADCEGSYPVAE